MHLRARQALINIAHAPKELTDEQRIRTSSDSTWDLSGNNRELEIQDLFETIAA
jgi:hypothetical protein